MHLGEHNKDPNRKLSNGSDDCCSKMMMEATSTSSILHYAESLLCITVASDDDKDLMNKVSVKIMEWLSKLFSHSLGH